MRTFNILRTFMMKFSFYDVIFLNLSMHWHLEFRYSIELFLMCHYYITRSFARSFTLFIIFEKNVFFNILYSYFSRSLHLCFNEVEVYMQRFEIYLNLSLQFNLN